MEFVAIDFETTGYEGGQVNEPWQLGAALVRDGAIVETAEWFFRTERAYAAPQGMTAGFPLSLMEQWEDLFGFLGGRRLVAHNLACEKTILTRVAPLTKWGPWTDTLAFAKARYPKLPSYRLGDLCTIFGCVPAIDGRTWHDGLYDAIACAELAIHFSADVILCR